MNRKAKKVLQALGGIDHTRKTSMLPCVELPDGQSDSGSTYIGLDLFLAIIREANTEPRT